MNRNLRQGQKDVRLFETATVFHREKESTGERIAENLSLAWIATGNYQADHWKFRARPLEFWDAKSWLNGLMAEWKVTDWTLDSADLPACLHPQEALRIVAAGRGIGFIGRIHPHQTARWEISPDTYLCEIDLNVLADRPSSPVRYQELPKHPAVIRDVSLVLPETTPWADIVSFLKKRFDLIEQTELFDVFKDASLPEKHRSLSFRLTLRHADKTLSDRESSDIFQSILDELQREFQGQLRTAAPK